MIRLSNAYHLPLVVQSSDTDENQLNQLNLSIIDLVHNIDEVPKVFDK